MVNLVEAARRNWRRATSTLERRTAAAGVIGMMLMLVAGLEQARISFVAESGFALSEASHSLSDALPMVITLLVAGRLALVRLGERGIAVFMWTSAAAVCAAMIGAAMGGDGLTGGPLVDRVGMIGVAANACVWLMYRLLLGPEGIGPAARWHSVTDMLASSLVIVGPRASAVHEHGPFVVAGAMFAALVILGLNVWTGRDRAHGHAERLDPRVGRDVIRGWLRDGNVAIVVPAEPGPVAAALDDRFARARVRPGSVALFVQGDAGLVIWQTWLADTDRTVDAVLALSRRLPFQAFSAEGGHVIALAGGIATPTTAEVPVDSPWRRLDWAALRRALTAPAVALLLLVSAAIGATVSPLAFARPVAPHTRGSDERRWTGAVPTGGLLGRG
jgi:hypothetical protein